MDRLDPRPLELLLRWWPQGVAVEHQASTAWGLLAFHGGGTLGCPGIATLAVHAPMGSALVFPGAAPG